ncbi:MAG: Endonuclease/Exonuclease/phosphatase family protein, partial [Propionibacteriaceae bacterium]|nr:Endonuclease/Exonuclease/phosphatase family protein [Propionibacteriaceae bacterium]
TAAQTGVRTIEGVVVGDYQGAGQFGGYFVQEENGDIDTDPLTSEGIFVFNTSFPVAVGDRVRVRGTAGEFSGQTQISSVQSTLTCAPAPAPTPAAVSFPVAAVSDLERFEGMAIDINQQLTVTELFTLARFGEVALSVGGRLETPTNAVAPGAPAIALQSLNDRSRILLDDGNNQQNIDPTIHPQGGLSATNTLRVGDSVPSLTGVLDFRFSVYRVQPVGPITFTHTNPRPAAPEPVGGNLQVAAFNVLNYFNGNGTGLDGADGGFPTARGASSLLEFNRQRAKIINAITALDADVVGLMELENDDTDAEFGAIEDLVAGLNAAAGSEAYDFIDTGVVGTDAIRVGIIYQPANVTPVGSHAIIDSGVDPRFIDTLNRPSIAQTFQLNGTGQKFTAVVNHLKSKGSDCNHVGDPDTGDGQGNCNITRTQAAEAMVDWLATDPTSSGDPDFMVLGDMNAYAKEDPITVFKNAGYVDTIDGFAGHDGYSFVFQGQSGYLDHALASPSLAAQVTDVTEWHINADEPVALDYNVEFKTPNHVTTLYDAGPYRSSDHDPALVGLFLGAVPTVDASGPYSVVEGSTVTVTATGSDPDNGTLTYAWDLDNNGTFETSGQSATFSAAGIEAPASRTIAVRVTDSDGFTATDSATVNVVWDFSGFFPPVLNLPEVNPVKAGSSVAIKFSLGGDQGLSIFAAGSPTSTPIDCVTREPLGAAQPIDFAGKSALIYSASTDTYTLSWKTAKNWTGCRRLSVTLADGTLHEADFRFTR